MTGFILTLAMLVGVMISMPHWNYSRKWGNKPVVLMSLATFVVGFLWVTERI